MEGNATRRLSRRHLLELTATGMVGAAGTALLAACGGQSTPASTAPASANTPAPAGAPANTSAAAQPAPKNGAPVEVRWQTRASTDIDAKGTQAVIDKAFIPNNPNIKLTLELAPDTQRDEKLVAAMVAGTAPDVFETWGDNVPSFADRGQVLDLNPLVKRDLKDTDVQDFYDWQWKAFILPSGIRFGMPKYVNVGTLWVNKDLFAKAGQDLPTNDWTHVEWADAAKKVAKVAGAPTDVYGLHYLAWNATWFWPIVERFGGHVVNPQDTTECLLGSPEAQSAFEWLRSLEWDAKVLAQPLALGAITDPAYPQFGAGKYAMAEDGFYPLRIDQAVNKSFKWQFFELPKGPKARKAFGSSDSYAIWSKTKQQDAAWVVANFGSGKDYQEAQITWNGKLPIRNSVLARWKDILLQTQPALAEVNLDAGPNAVKAGYPGERVLFKKDAAAMQLIVPALEKIFVSGNTPVSYLKDIATQVTKDQRAN